MARIPEEKIEEIRSAADIVEVIGGYLSLKRRGRNFLAICPFHSEKTPSFSVSPERQIYHCFGCGKGGNVFGFLMEHEKLTFLEVVTQLAERYGIPLPRVEDKVDTRFERQIFLHQVAAAYYQDNLIRPGFREKIEPYLFETRGLKPEIVAKFQLGLATDQWKGLIEYAAGKGIAAEELFEAGLAIRSEKSGDYLDRFRLRLMIPIFNLTGKIIAFGGRALRRGETAKYMNSPESPLYNKSQVLYGLNFAKTAIRESSTCILVEGYFDLISLVQTGIENVVAVSGTAFTPQQARLLSRFARKAYLFFDADSAGRAAALRSVENFFNAGIEPLIVVTPPAHDPDTFVKQHGATGIYNLLEESVSYVDFRFGRIDGQALGMNEKEQVVREVRELGAKIDDPLRREIFFDAVASRLKLSQAVFVQETKGKASAELRPERVRNINMIEAEFLSLFVARPTLIESVWNDISPEDLKGPGHAAIYIAMMSGYRRTGEIAPDRLIEDMSQSTEKSALAFIATLEWGDLDLIEVTRDYRQFLFHQKRDARIIDLRRALVEAEDRDDRELAKKLDAEIKYLLENRP